MIALPHVAGSTEEAFARITDVVIEQPRPPRARRAAAPSRGVNASRHGSGCMRPRRCVVASNHRDLVRRYAPLVDRREARDGRHRPAAACCSRSSTCSVTSRCSAAATCTTRYAHFLQELWEVKWPVRAGLLALARRSTSSTGDRGSSRATARRGRSRTRCIARSSSSACRAHDDAGPGSSCSRSWSFHILHFTLGQVQPAYFHTLDPQRAAGTRTRCTSHAFQNPAIYGVYLVGMALLADAPRPRRVVVAAVARAAPSEVSDRQGRAAIVGVVLFVGYMVPPTAVLVGVIKCRSYVKLDAAHASRGRSSRSGRTRSSR